MSRTPLAWQNVPRHTTIIANICALLMLVHSSATFLLICLDNLKLLALTSTPKLPRSVLKDLLVFVGKRSHFVFDGQYCHQIDAGAMGFPFTTCCGQYFYLRFREKLSNE